MEWMQIVGWIWSVAMLWCIWEWWVSPCYPRDYKNNEEQDENE